MLEQYRPDSRSDLGYDKNYVGSTVKLKAMKLHVSTKFNFILVFIQQVLRSYGCNDEMRPHT